MPVSLRGFTDGHPPSPPPGVDPRSAAQIDAAIEPYMIDALSALDGRAPLLSGMVRYHLGYLEADFSGASDQTHAQSRGKRLRPAIALLSCEAADGAAATAAPVAAALELLHNFSLIHDDIQDKSDLRRHRRTVWSLWGIEQAINAGDALFAVAHLPLVRLLTLGVPGEIVVRLVEAFNRMTIEIVEGQVLDLGFEGRADVTPDDYLEMISGKTAAIVRYAAWAGATLAGVSEARAAEFGEFGLALGVGYQVRDDALGVWGSPETTGKPSADDIRRRKQSLPIVILRAAASPSELAELQSLYATDPVDEAGVADVVRLLDHHAVAAEVERQVSSCHDAARRALAAAVGSRRGGAAQTLAGMVDQLAARTF